MCLKSLLTSLALLSGPAYTKSHIIFVTLLSCCKTSLMSGNVILSLLLVYGWLTSMEVLLVVVYQAFIDKRFSVIWGLPIAIRLIRQVKLCMKSSAVIKLLQVTFFEESWLFSISISVSLLLWSVWLYQLVMSLTAPTHVHLCVQEVWSSNPWSSQALLWPPSLQGR